MDSQDSLRFHRLVFPEVEVLDEVTTRQLRELLRQHFQIETVGSQVAELIRRHFGRAFHARAYGFANLRELLERCAPELRVVGRSGVDVVYRWIDEPGMDGAKRWLENSQIPTPWSAWATPGSKHNVVLGEEQPRSISASDKPGPHEHLIRGTTPEEHREIAIRFLAQQPQLSPSIRAELHQALELDDEHWWLAWIRALRGERELHSGWLRHRLRELRTLLARRLDDLGLNKARQQAILASMMPPRKATTNSLEQGASDSRTAAVAPSSAAALVAPSRDLRSLVLEAVRRMELEDLRALRIPVGIILDIQAEL